MDAINVKRVSQIDNDINEQISGIFVDGFYQWLQFFSKDREALKKAFAHMFNPEVFYVALCDDRVVGIAACTYGKTLSVRLDKKELKKHLGSVKGGIAYTVLKKEFEEKPYPFPVSDNMGLIEFVATSPKYRGKGVASAMFRYFFETTFYTEYVLEAADTNTNAVRLYEKLGFFEFMRVKQKNSKRSGVNNLLYMKKIK